MDSRYQLMPKCGPLLLALRLSRGRTNNGGWQVTGQRWFSSVAQPLTYALLCWYDATQITGQADDSALTTWPDASGNGWTMTAAGNGQITYYSSTAGKTVNGHPAVWFPGSAAGAVGAYMATSAPVADSVAGITMFVVAGIATTPAGGQSGQCPFFNGNGAVGQNGYGPALMTYSAEDKGWLAGGIAWESTTQAYDLNIHLLTLQMTPTNALLWIDGTAVTVGYTTPNNPLDYTLLGVHAPSGGTGAVFLPGPLCEARMYDNLSAANIASINSALLTKWGI